MKYNLRLLLVLMSTSLLYGCPDSSSPSGASASTTADAYISITLPTSTSESSLQPNDAEVPSGSAEDVASIRVDVYQGNSLIASSDMTQDSATVWSGIISNLPTSTELTFDAYAYNSSSSNAIFTGTETVSDISSGVYITMQNVYRVVSDEDTEVKLLSLTKPSFVVPGESGNLTFLFEYSGMYSNSYVIKDSDGNTASDISPNSGNGLLFNDDLVLENTTHSLVVAYSPPASTTEGTKNFDITVTLLSSNSIIYTWGFSVDVQLSAGQAQVSISEFPPNFDSVALRKVDGDTLGIIANEDETDYFAYGWEESEYLESLTGTGGSGGSSGTGYYSTAQGEFRYEELSDNAGSEPAGYYDLFNCEQYNDEFGYENCHQIRSVEVSSYPFNSDKYFKLTISDDSDYDLYYGGSSSSGGSSSTGGSSSSGGYYYQDEVFGAFPVNSVPTTSVIFKVPANMFDYDVIYENE